MKVIVRIIFDKQEVLYEIPVGMGDKSFKWLGLVACNRFSDSCPDGSLRRRDPVRRGINDKATHQPVEMALPDGQIPHPSALLYDFLSDGDEVKVHLVDSQNLSRDDGTPLDSEWAKLAFKSNSRRDTNNDTMNNSTADGGVDASEVEKSDGDSRYTSQQQHGRAQFMRILMKSQMLNHITIEDQVASIWKIVSKAMPKLAKNINNELQAIFIENWDMLTEIFRYFCKISNGPDGRLPKDGFYKMLSEAGVYPENELGGIYVRIFDRALGATDPKEATLSLGGLMVALILCAQTKYNDTYNESNIDLGAGAGLKDILNDFYIVAERCDMKSMLKSVFTATSTLNQLREWHDELFAVFNKYAGRTKELPSSMSYKDFTDMLYDAGLTEPSETDTKGNPVTFEHDTAAALLVSVREGSINGRPARQEESARGGESKGGLPDDVIPEDEFTYPEMAESICRHSFNRFRGTKPDDEGNYDFFDYAGDLSVLDSFVKGLVSVIGTLSLKK
jgi:hypothetical protein